MEKVTKALPLIGIIVGVIAVMFLLTMGYKPGNFTVFGIEFNLQTDTPTATPVQTQTLSIIPVYTSNSIPTFNPIPTITPTLSLGNWIMTVGKYSSIELAKYDIVNYTTKGYRVEVFCSVSEVTPGGPVEVRAAIVGFTSEDAVNLEAPNVWKLNPAAQIKQLDLWCPNLLQSGDYISCNYNTCP